MKALFLAALFVSCVMSHSIGQNKPGKELRVFKTSQAITIDGVLDEEAWKMAKTADNFFLNYPSDTLPPTNATEAWITFDDRFLYVAVKCYTDGTPPVAQNMRRDWGQASRLHDVIYLTVGPFADKANAYWFGISPPGIQYDGIISGGGETGDGYNDFWDSKWYSKIKVDKDYWTGEMAIPFKSFRYEHKVIWDINFLRGDAKSNEMSHWIAIPIQYMVGSLAYQGKMVTADSLPKSGSNIVFIPYSTFSANRAGKGSPSDRELNGGFDAKVGITPSLNLDLTFNPDFSHVEVDQQVINLTRFEYNFPERRQFFLENGDLFGQLGLPAARPFFTRRIGLAADSVGNLQKVPILYGARMSGKLGNLWRIGAMNLHTSRQKSLGLPDQNYSVVVAQRRVLSRSYISGFMINKQSIGLERYDSTSYYHSDLLYRHASMASGEYQFNTYNRVAGADFSLLTTNNRWSGKLYYHRSFSEFTEDKTSSFGSLLEYNTRALGIRGMYQGVGENFNAETGFVPGLDVYRGFKSATVKVRKSFYPNEGKIISWVPSVETAVNLLPDGTFTDFSTIGGCQVNFLNKAFIKGELRDLYQKLPANFNPIAPKGDSLLLKGQHYRWQEYEVQFQSDLRRSISYLVGTGGGEFYIGSRQSLFGEIAYRFQPFALLAMGYNYTKIDFPNGFGRANFVLLSPRVEITLHPNLYINAFAQYNSRFDNVNLNARLQWRFKPASDIFLVYTENYLPMDFSSKNRSLVFKINYWLNI